MHITITGNLGSGKSTVCKLLNERYHFEVYSTGKVQRELAAKMNMTTLELNQMMRSDKKYDTMIDDETTRISREKKDQNIIFDSRLAWYFAEDTFKVFISVSLDEAAHRVFHDKRGDVENYTSIEEAKEALAKRAETENIRYKEIYNLNYMDFNNYNLVIDSTFCSPELIADIIIKEAREYECKGYNKTKRLVSPRRLIKDSDIDNDDKVKLKELIENYKDMSNNQYIIDKVIKVKPLDEQYTIVDGLDHVKAAYIADALFVQIEVLDS
ncbi:MAG: AAA family ATPase [Clostridiales bacterium]|nr:AAA family ATPase [Clostridiales bacterium]